MQEGSSLFVHAGHAHGDPSRPPDPGLRKPVTVVAGFLGAGKTTLLNHILSRLDDRIEVVVREYGDLGIDQELIHADLVHILVITAASIFIDPQTKLYWGLEGLYRRCDKLGAGRFSWRDVDFDRVLLETSGLDLPEHMASLFYLDRLRDHFRLDCTVVVVDAEYGELTMDQYRRAREQVAFADVLLVNKTDLADERMLDRLERRLRRMNPLARIIRTEYTTVALDEIVDVGLFDGVAGFDALSDVQVVDAGEEETVNDFQSIVLTEARPLDKEKVNAWISELFKRRGQDILRSKGFLFFAGYEERFVFQGVRKTFHSKADRLWRPDEERRSTIVLIGEHLDDVQELQRAFSACVA